MARWDQPSLFPEGDGAQWQLEVTCAPGRDDLIVTTRALLLPKWNQIHAETAYLNRTEPGLMNACDRLWSLIHDRGDQFGLKVGAMADYDPGPPF